MLPGMRIFFRTLLVLAGALTLIAPPAVASAADDPIQTRGHHCDPFIKAKRCAYFNYDTRNGNIRAWGTIENTSGETATLKLHVYLEALSGSSWAPVSSGPLLTGSGGNGFQLVGNSGNVATCSHGRTYRSRANWNWNTEFGTVYSGAVVAC
jgi:hypothetical protein